MNNEQTVRGYRIVGERKADKSLSYDYLQLKPEASHALKDLWREAPVKGANCLNQEDLFRGDTQMTDSEAQLACAGCPMLDLCKKTAEAQHPAWGTWGGKVYGRALEAIEKEESNDNDGS